MRPAFIKGKRGLELTSFVVSGLLFSLVIVVFFVLVNPPTGDGFWSGYGYGTSPSSTDYDISGELSETATDAACNFNPSGSECPSKPAISYVSGLGDFASGMLKGGYSVLTSIVGSIGSVRVAGAKVMEQWGVDPAVQAILIAILVFSVTMAIVYLIFNRSA